MAEAAFFVLTGMGLLVLLFFWSVRTAVQAPPADDVAKIGEALAAIRIEPLPQALGERIFAEEDWRFVSKAAEPAVQRAFLNERKALALFWLHRTRQTVSDVMKVHRKVARSSANLSPWLELQLAFQFLSFVAICDSLTLMIRLRGPFASRRTVAYAFSLADRLAYFSGLVLIGLDAAQLNRLAPARPPKSAVS